MSRPRLLAGIIEGIQSKNNKDLAPQWPAMQLRSHSVHTFHECLATSVFAVRRRGFFTRCKKASAPYFSFDLLTGFADFGGVFELATFTIGSSLDAL